MTDTLSTTPTEQECTVEIRSKNHGIIVVGSQALCKYAVKMVAVAGAITIVLVTVVKSLAEIKETEITSRYHDHS